MQNSFCFQNCRLTWRQRRRRINPCKVISMNQLDCSLDEWDIYYYAWCNPTITVSTAQTNVHDWYRRDWVTTPEWNQAHGWWWSIEKRSPLNISWPQLEFWGDAVLRLSLLYRPNHGIYPFPYLSRHTFHCLQCRVEWTLFRCAFRPLSIIKCRLRRCVISMFPGSTTNSGYWETKFFYWKRLNASDAQLVIPERYNVRVLGAKDDVCKTLGLWHP